MRIVQTVIWCLLAGAWMSAAETPSRRLPRSTPEAQGISSAAILGFIESAEARINALHSFMLLRHGQVVAEGWWSPHAAGEEHVLASLSKSFTSTAVGLAVAEGRLGIDDPVLRFFPDKAPAAPSADLQAMRVRDLLTMATGHRKEDIESFPYRSFPLLPARNLVKAFFEMPIVHKPGTQFIYDSAASYLLSAIVQKVTGQTVRDYLRPRLFEPLGMGNPTWETSAQGVSFGGFGLSLRTEDLACFGQLYLQKGEWKGRQLVPASWVEAATSRQIANGVEGTSDWNEGYGYQFWRCRHGFYRGDGARGQFCIVMPQYDAVMAITSDTDDMAAVMNLVWNVIVPAFRDAPLPANPAASEKLRAKSASLDLRHRSP
jgi:CubicO group peptidase (beta-lactamase class C family)